MKKLLYLFLVLPLIFSSCKKQQGCTDPIAVNYNADAEENDGSCTYILGCTNSLAMNFNYLATVDDGSCEPFVYGCTNPTASNYNYLANTDDGSCTYCKWCELASETMNGYPMAELDAMAVLMGYSDWNAYISNSFGPPQEFCDDELDAAEEVSSEADANGDGTMDYRIYYDCN